MKALVPVLCFWCLSTVQAADIIDTETFEHGQIEPGHSIGQVVSFPKQDHIPLVTVLSHDGSSTVLYLIDEVGQGGAIIRCFNYGPYGQAGKVTIAVWD